MNACNKRDIIKVRWIRQVGASFLIISSMILCMKIATLKYVFKDLLLNVSF